MPTVAKKKPTKKQKQKIKTVMHEWKEGELHIGKSDKNVESQKQAVAIALSEAGLSRKKRKAKSRRDADTTPNISLALKQIINTVYRDGADAVMSYNIDDIGTITGLFRDGREVFDYAITASGQISYIETSNARKDAYLEGFYLAGRVPDSSISNTYTRSVLDIELNRLDAKKPRNCTTGKSCGGSCIAKGLKCIQQLGQREQRAIKQIAQAIKTKQSESNPALEKLKRYAPVIAGAGGLGAIALVGAGVAIAGGRQTTKGKPEQSTNGAATTSRSRQEPIDKKRPGVEESPWDSPEPDPWEGQVKPKESTPLPSQVPAISPTAVSQSPSPETQNEPILRKATSSESIAAKDTLFNRNTGNNIVQALDIQGFDKDMSSKLKNIANQIQKTVNVPNLAKIPVQPVSESNDDGNYYSATCTNRETGEFLGKVPLKIEIAPNSPRPESALVHEVGHFFHHTAIGDPKEGYKGKIKPEMQELFDAASRTRAVKNIDKLARSARRKDIREHSQYLNQPEEIFARMFTQYVAKKSGSKVLQVQIKVGQKGKAVEYWDDREFSRTIEPAMDKFAKDMGWR